MAQIDHPHTNDGETTQNRLMIPIFRPQASGRQAFRRLHAKTESPTVDQSMTKFKLSEKNRLIAAITLILLGSPIAACNDVSTAKGFEAIRQRGELRVAMSGQYPPFNYFDSQNQLVGFDVDIAREIAKRLAIPAKLITLRWDGIVAGLTAGRYDVIIGSMAITPEREQAVDFSDPYYVSGAQVFARPDSPVALTGKLDGAVVGVDLGTTYEQAVRRQAAVKAVQTYGGTAEILLDLGNKRIDAFVTDRLVGFSTQKTRGATFLPIGEPLYTETIGIAMAKDQPQLRLAVNEALAHIKRDGTYTRISQTWFGRDIGADRPGVAASAS
jgi:polar amino acid transport system substrate-binding protein